MKYPGTLVALDIETTDISPQKGEIIEVAVVKYRNGKEVDKFSTLTKPKGKIPAIVKSITNISDEDVKGYEPFSEVREEVEKFIGDFPIVGHNIIFDVRFLQANDIPLKNNKLFDTWKLSTIAYQGEKSFSLEALTERLDLAHAEKHRAEYDAIAGMKLFEHLLGRLSEVDPGILVEIETIMRQTDWPFKDIFAEVAKNISITPKKKSKKAASKNKDEDSPVEFSPAKVVTLLDEGGEAKKKMVIIKADEKIDLGLAVKVMDIAKQAEAEGLVISTKVRENVKR